MSFNHPIIGWCYRNAEMGADVGDGGVEHLILLVGSNPLPNYLTALTLRPRKITLIYSEQTKKPKERLKKTLKQFGFDIRDRLLEDAASAFCTENLLKDVMLSGEVRDVWLAYTGGTKVMAVHARLAFEEAGGKREQVVYLDEGGEEREPRLRYDDGREELLSDLEGVGFSLDTLLTLHGFEWTQHRDMPNLPTMDDAFKIMDAFMREAGQRGFIGNDENSLVRRLHRKTSCMSKYKNNPRKCLCDKEVVFKASKFGLELSQEVVPTAEQLGALQNRDERKSWFRRWCSFLGGGWFEEWVAEQVRRVGLKPKPEVVVGVNAVREESGRQCEIDVAVIRGCRVHFISCTTDSNLRLCKSKLFEIAVRARQLGGDLARAALVCLADGNTTGELQKDIDDAWEASNTPRVFGFEDVKRWYIGDITSLAEWLES